MAMRLERRLSGLRLAGVLCVLIVGAALLPAACVEPVGPIGGQCEVTDDCYTVYNYHPGTFCNELTNQCTCPVGQTECCIKGSTGILDCRRQCRRPEECECPNEVCPDTQVPGQTQPQCVTAQDCPQPDPRCGTTACVGRECKMTLVDKPASQLVGDCKVTVCNVEGKVEERGDPSDVFNDGNQCTFDACSVEGPVNILMSGPCPESSGFCNINGKCASCDSDVDCISPDLPFCSPEGKCSPSPCNDGVKSAGTSESDIDCGGGCDLCEAGQLCNTSADCIDNHCAGGKCANATCNDGIQNDSESDVDCGSSSCLPCKDGKKCSSNLSCESGVCVAGGCQSPSCTDGVKNGKEVSIDCGGGCGPCFP